MLESGPRALSSPAWATARISSSACSRTPCAAPLCAVGCWARLHLQLLLIRLRQQGERERETETERDRGERERERERERQTEGESGCKPSGGGRDVAGHLSSTPGVLCGRFGSGGWGGVTQVSPVCCAPGPAELASPHVLRVRPEPAGDHPLLRI